MAAIIARDIWTETESSALDPIFSDSSKLDLQHQPDTIAPAGPIGLLARMSQ